MSCTITLFSALAGNIKNVTCSLTSLQSRKISIQSLNWHTATLFTNPYNIYKQFINCESHTAQLLSKARKELANGWRGMRSVNKAWVTGL